MDGWLAGAIFLPGWYLAAEDIFWCSRCQFSLYYTSTGCASISCSRTVVSASVDALSDVVAQSCRRGLAGRADSSAVLLTWSCTALMPVVSAPPAPTSPGAALALAR